MKMIYPRNEHGDVHFVTNMETETKNLVKQVAETVGINVWFEKAKRPGKSRKVMYQRGFYSLFTDQNNLSKFWKEYEKQEKILEGL